MKYLATLTFIFLSFYSYSQVTFTQLGQDIDGSNATDELGKSVSLNNNGNVLAVGVPNFDVISPGNDGLVKIYEWDGLNWIQKGSNINGESSNLFGISVAISDDGNTFVAGATNNSDGGFLGGQVQVYEWNGTNWIQKGNDINGGANDRLGFSVAINGSGDTIAVGSTGYSSNTGKVSVYEWDGSNWIMIGASVIGEVSGDGFGASVSLSNNGTILAVGAPNNDGNGTNAGHVRVFEWDGTSWTQKGADIDGKNASNYSGFSNSLSSNGNILAIGSYGNSDFATGAGHVRVFEWNGTTWTQKGTDLQGEAAQDKFGRSVSLNNSGNILAAGTNENDGNGSDAGHVRIFLWNGTAWIQQGNDIDGEAADDHSGFSISLSKNSNRVAIGAFGNDDGGSDAGHARVYSIDGIVGQNELKMKKLNPIYPTPNNGVFNIVLEEKSNIEIFNVLGEQVYINSGLNNNIQIDISNQPKGIYFINIKGEKSNSSLKTIIN